jgi:hypothetical protein
MSDKLPLSDMIREAHYGERKRREIRSDGLLEGS